VDFRLSHHAKKRINQRKINHDWIQLAIDHVDVIENDTEDPTLLHALIEIPERNFKTLRVIYNETTDPITVVTAYFE